MEKSISLRKIISRAAAAACTLCIAAAAFGVRKADSELRLRDIPNEFSPQTAALSAVGSDGGSDGRAADIGSDSAADGDPDDVTENNSGRADEGEPDSGSPRLPSAPENNINTDTDADGSRDGGYSPADGNSPDAPHSPELPSDSPTDGDESDERLFTTSIVDGEHVKNAEYAFTVTHLHSDYRLKTFVVKVNGVKVQWTGSVILSEKDGGKNNIRVYASYADPDGKVHSGYAEYTVWLDDGDDDNHNHDYDSKPADDSRPEGESSSEVEDNSSSEDSESGDTEPRLVTDLTNMTIAEESLTFYAAIEGGDNVQLKAYLGGKRLDESGGGEYSCALDMGLNTVRLKGSAEWRGEVYEFSENYEIRRIAETTPETAPTLAYCNAPESVRGDVFTLDLIAQDHSGGRIYDDGIAVVLNGRTVKCSWIGEYTSYKLDLVGGENTLDIRVTDSEGRYSDYSYIINCTALADGDVIGVCRMTVDAATLGLGELCAPIEFEILQGENALDSIVRSLEKAGFAPEVSGGYLAGLGAPDIAAGAAIPEDLLHELEADSNIKFTEPSQPDMLHDKDFTSLSGWMISVGGHYISYGMSDLHLKDGDVLQLRFSLAAGRDIGDSGAGESYAVTY